MACIWANRIWTSRKCFWPVSWWSTRQRCQRSYSICCIFSSAFSPPGYIRISCPPTIRHFSPIAPNVKRTHINTASMWCASTKSFCSLRWRVRCPHYYTVGTKIPPINSANSQSSIRAAICAFAHNCTRYCGQRCSSRSYQYWLFTLRTV